MSIEVEMNGKAGRLCEPARKGELRCPLIVRPTSEDVIVGNVFGLLRHIRPHLWLNDLLNAALGVRLFRQVWFREFSMRLWERQAPVPSELLGFREGRNEPDVLIEWENPPTTVWIEAKWLSKIGSHSTHAEGNDQATRGIRTLLNLTGNISTHRLFSIPARRPVWLSIARRVDETEWRHLRQAIRDAANERTSGFAPGENTLLAGHVSWKGLAEQLLACKERCLPVEARVFQQISDYVAFKMTKAARDPTPLPSLPPLIDYRPE